MDWIKRLFTFDKVVLYLLILAAFIIPVEHKYDKPLRHISAALIPEGLAVPRFYEKKLSYYPSDLIAFVLAMMFLLKPGVSFRKLLLEKGNWLIGSLICFSLLSILQTTFNCYPTPYIRCFQLLTPLIFLATLTNGLPNELIRKGAHLILGAIVAAALFQSVVALAQYAHQGSIGLRILGEQPFDAISNQFPLIQVPEGRRWIFDSLFSIARSTNQVVRTVGTMHHPNPLGGFLGLSILFSFYFLNRHHGKKWGTALLSFAIFLQSIALATTYSRSAIFGLVLSLSAWFFLLFIQIKGETLKDRMILFLKTRSIKHSLFIAIASCALCAGLFFEQYSHRGGVFNYSKQAQKSDETRIYYQHIALHMLKDRPFTGVGYQLFSVEGKKYVPDLEKGRISAVHNVYLLLASETGLFSLIAFLLWIGWIGKTFYQSEKNPLSLLLFSAFIGFLFIGLCDFYPLAFTQGRMMFFLTAGLFIATMEKEHALSRSLSDVRSDLPHLR